MSAYDDDTHKFGHLLVEQALEAMSDPTVSVGIRDNDGELVDRGIDERTHLILRELDASGAAVSKRIACGKPFSECRYYVSSRRYVDCEACLSYDGDVTVSQTEGER